MKILTLIRDKILTELRSPTPNLQKHKIRCVTVRVWKMGSIPCLNLTFWSEQCTLLSHLHRYPFQMMGRSEFLIHYDTHCDI